MASRSIILELPRGVRRRLQRLRGKTHDKTEFRRCQILLAWAAGRAPEQIATALGCAVSTVYRTVQAFRRDGEAAVQHRYSPGRPPKVRPADEGNLDQTIAREPRACGLNFSNWSAAKLALYLKLAVHAVTILRHLWALGWRWRRPVPRIASPDPAMRPKPAICGVCVGRRVKGSCTCIMPMRWMWPCCPRSAGGGCGEGNRPRSIRRVRMASSMCSVRSIL